jgi:hypothetical protein
MIPLQGKPLVPRLRCGVLFGRTLNWWGEITVSVDNLQLPVFAPGNVVMRSV